MRIALVGNPGSGSADDADPGTMMEELGAEVVHFPIERASEAAGSGAGRIAVAGGDGSIAPAALAAIEAGVELAVIPLGTANDFARRMGIPDEPAAAVRVAVEGAETRTVDLARIGGRPFLNLVSLGLSPMAAAAAEDLKPKLGAFAYTVGALRAGIAGDPVGCRIACDGDLLFEGEAWQAMVGCTGAFGGGATVDADADDGQLDVVVIEAGARAALAKHAVGMRTGTIEGQRGVHTDRSAKVLIEVEGMEEDLNVDGEIVSSGEVGGADLEFAVQQQALRLVNG
jgi:diacylglycerol kinase family enzyme